MPTPSRILADRMIRDNGPLRSSLKDPLGRVIEVGASFVVLDTSTEMQARVVEHWRASTTADRLANVAALNDSVEQLAEAGVRLRFPSASPEEVHLRVLALRLGRDVMVRVYGWDPDRAGW